MKTNDYITPYTWQTLRGRLMHYPGNTQKKTNFILVYGQHASLERISGIAEALAAFGPVWVPDMPGFGGMESFYKIHKKPTVENYADYLKDFIDTNIGSEPFVIVGMSFGFANVTRMLQKYPALQKQAALVVSFVGFTGARDFHFKPRIRGQAVVAGAKLSRNIIGATFFDTLIKLGVFDIFYKLQLPKPQPYDKVAKAARKAIVKQKGYLWRINDRRTHAFTAHEFIFDLDLRGQQVPLTVHHLGVSFDHYFDHKEVIKHIKEIYADAVDYTLGLANHSPDEDASAAEVLEIIPPALKDILRQLP